VYAPAWFEMKNAPSCKDGARHVHSTILKSRYLTDELKKVVDPVIQRNAFFSHPENLLLAMLTDERPDIRELALRRILKSRKQKRTSSVRSSCVPVLNFEANSYIDMIDWQKTPIAEPPIVMDINVKKTFPFKHFFSVWAELHIENRKNHFCCLAVLASVLVV
jgi:hypothetical protein